MPRKKKAKPIDGDTPLFNEQGQPAAAVAEPEPVEETPHYELPPTNRCKPEPFAKPKRRRKSYGCYLYKTDLGAVWPHGSSPDDALGHLKASRFRGADPQYDGRYTNVKQLAKDEPDALVVLRVGRGNVVEVLAKHAEAKIEKLREGRRRERAEREAQKARRQAKRQAA